MKHTKHSFSSAIDSAMREYYKEKIYKIVKLSSGISMFPYGIYSWIEGTMGRLRSGYITHKSDEIYFTGNFELLKIYPPVTKQSPNKFKRQIFLNKCLIEEVKK